MAFDGLEWIRIFVFVGQNCMAEDKIATLVVHFDIC